MNITRRLLAVKTRAWILVAAGRWLRNDARYFGHAEVMGDPKGKLYYTGKGSGPEFKNLYNVGKAQRESRRRDFA